MGPPNISVRDPSAIIEANGKYYLYGTGIGIKQWSSTDMKTWVAGPDIFKTAPSWTTAQIPDFKNDIWGPDISYYKGKYYLFYSVSQYGTINSAIGYATNTTLNPSDSTYKWADQGKLLESGGSGYNAIDPNFIADDNGTPYIAFGSFYNGITISKFQNDTLKLNAKISPDRQLLAKRSAAVIAATINDIEAPFILKHNNYYYLFASIGSCCAGVSSTYQTIVGRSATINGVYQDRNGTAMADGGGEVVLAADSKEWHGAGGESVFTIKGVDYITYFSFDDSSTERLRISQLYWDGNWWPHALFFY